MAPPKRRITSIMSDPLVERTDNIPVKFDYTLIKSPEQIRAETIIAKDALKKYDSVPKHKKEKLEREQKERHNKARLEANREANLREAEQADYHLTHGNPFLFAWHWAKSKPWLLGKLEEGDTFTNIGTPPLVGTVSMPWSTFFTSTAGGAVGGELGERYLGGESGREFGNFLGMLGGGYGGARVWRWGNTPIKVGEGSTKEAWTTPFSRRITLYGGNPDYIAYQNTLPETVPQRFEGYTLDGRAIHSSPKMTMVKSPGKRLMQKLADKGFFPSEVEGDVGYSLISPERLEAITDIEFGRNWFGKRKLVDPELLTIPEYMSVLKRGGKLKINNYVF